MSYLIKTKPIEQQSDMASSAKKVQEIDFFTKEPRRVNYPYSSMHPSQMDHTKRNANPDMIFSTEYLEPLDYSRHYMDRHTYMFDRANTRGYGPMDYFYLGPHLTRDIPEDHNNSLAGALFPWGPDKLGQKSLRHNLHQDMHRFLNIDVYKRNPTNYEGPVVNKYGRGTPGYYGMRNQDRHMWFGGKDEPKTRVILESIAPKTKAEYAENLKVEQLIAQERFPDITQYTEKMLLRKKSRGACYSLEARKLHLARAKEYEK